MDKLERMFGMVCLCDHCTWGSVGGCEGASIEYDEDGNILECDEFQSCTKKEEPL